MEQWCVLIVGESVGLYATLLSWLVALWSGFIWLLCKIPDLEGKHTHAHTVFLELSVAFNTVLATFKDLREYKRKVVTDFVKERVDQMEAWQKDVKIPKLTELIERVLTSYENCERWQDWLSKFCPKWAIASACIGTVIIYADWIDPVGWACGILILPFPVYWGAATYSYSSCLKTCGIEAEKFKTMIGFFPGMANVGDLVNGLIKNGTPKSNPDSPVK